MQFNCRRLQIWIILLFAVKLSGCTVGPNFHSPIPPTNIHSYTYKPFPNKTVSVPKAGRAGKAQHFLKCEDIPGEWWYLFHSQEINDLVKIGLINSPNLAAAEAALRQAAENLRAQIGFLLFPQVNGQFSAQRQRFSGQQFGASSMAGPSSSNVFNLYNAQINVSYTLDLFGGNRRQLEAFAAQVDYQQYQLAAAYLTLTSNIVTTAISLASFQAQIDATKDLINAQAYQLTILKKQFELGGISKVEVLTQETLLEQTRATLPLLEKSYAQAHHALSVLAGMYPNSELPSIKLEELNLPGELPISIPSQLVCQRPDVRAAEALLHAASAQIGVAIANMFPQLNLTANYGFLSDTFPKLFSSDAKVWSMMGTLTQPIFNGGALLAQRRAAIAAYQQACAQYRQTVLQAFQNVADALRALETDARALRDQKRAEVAAHNALRLVELQYKLGGVTYLFLLNAQQQYHQARILRIRAEANRYSDTAALFQALGGGWWNIGKC